MAIKILGNTVIDDSRNITNINTTATGNTTITGWINTSSDGYFAGNVGIGNSTLTNAALNIFKTISTDMNAFGIRQIIYDANVAVTANKTKTGLSIELYNQNQNKTAAGANASLINYVGITSNVYNGNTASGDARAQSLYGIRTSAINSANGPNSNSVSGQIVGLMALALQGGGGNVGTMYGVYTTSSVSGNPTGNISTSIGVYSYVSGYTTAVVNTGYIFRGGIDNTYVTTAYGISLTGEAYNYFSGNVGIGNTTPVYKLRVDGTTSLAGAVSDITTLAAGNTTITGFMNVSTNVVIGNTTVSSILTGNNIAIRADGADGNTSVVTSANSVYFSQLFSTVSPGATNTFSLELTGNSSGVGGLTFSRYASAGVNAVITIAPNSISGYNANSIGGADATKQFQLAPTQFLLANGVIFYANNTAGTAGQVLTTSGSGVYWSTVAGVNTEAQYTWSNTHLFNANVSVNSVFTVVNSTANVLFAAANGNVGIGTSTPSDRFQVAGTGSIDFSGRVDSATASDRASFRFIHTGGSLTTQSPSASRLGLVSFAGISDSSALTTYSFFDSFLEGAANSTANSFIRFQTTSLGTSAERFRIGPNAVTVSANLILGSTGLSANGGFGTAGQSLHTNGTATYWANADGLTTTDIPGSADLNTYTTAGIYHQGLNVQAASGSNYPIAEAGLLEVYTGGSMVYQRYTHFSTGTIYTRSKYLTTWYEWDLVLDDANFSSYALPLSGGSMTGDISFTANSGKGINFNGTDTTMHRIYLDSFYTIFKSHANEGWKFRDNSNADKVTILGASGNITTSGNVSATSYYASSWFRSTGASGWYNETYGGGMWQDNSSQVKVYANKQLWAGAAAGTTYGSGDSSSQFQVQNASGTGDGDVAAISFHCAGYYGMKLHLRADGYFGWGGWSASAWRFYQYLGNGDVTAAGNITAYSDIRLKENITPLENSLDKIKKLNGVRFTWKDLPDIVGAPGKADFGILAHEVEAVAPELISQSPHESPDGDRYKTVAYDKLVPILIEAVKDLSGQVEYLKEELKKLKGE